MGFEAEVTSGFRTRAKQKELYELWKAGAHPYPVARPGTSDHEIGMAIDVVSNNEKLLVELLTQAGLHWAGPDDRVHFSLLTVPQGFKLYRRIDESKKKDWLKYGREHAYRQSWRGLGEKVLGPIIKAATLGALKVYSKGLIETEDLED